MDLNGWGKSNKAFRELSDEHFASPETIKSGEEGKLPLPKQFRRAVASPDSDRRSVR